MFMDVVNHHLPYVSTTIYPIPSIIIDMTMGERLRELRKAAGLDQVQTAEIAGTTKQYVSQLESGKNRNPNGDYLAKWAKHFGVSAEWLAGGRGVKDAAPRYISDDGWKDVLGYAQAAGLSDGAEAEEYAVTHNLKFRAESLARKRLSHKNLAVFYGDGDSMEPRIQSGDAILFDQSDTKPRDGHIYVVLVPGAGADSYSVKRCELIDDMVFFKADNPKGDHGWKKPKRMDDARHPIKIIGRVRWIGSWEG